MLYLVQAILFDACYLKKIERDWRLEYTVIFVHDLPQYVANIWMPPFREYSPFTNALLIREMIVSIFPD